MTALRVCAPCCGVSLETISGGTTCERELLTSLGRDGVWLEILLGRGTPYPADVPKWTVDRANPKSCPTCGAGAGGGRTATTHWPPSTGLVGITGWGLLPRTALTFSDRQSRESVAMTSLFPQEVVTRANLSAGGFNVRYRHSDADVERKLQACRVSLGVPAEGVDADNVEARTVGPVIQPLFRRA